jgi:hypothetical protein
MRIVRPPVRCSLRHRRATSISVVVVEREDDATFEWPLSDRSTVYLNARCWPNSDRIQRPLSRATLSHLGLLRHFKRIINFDAEISHGAF